MTFILYLIFFVFFIGLFALLAVLGFIRKILGLGRRKNNSSDTQNPFENHQSTEKPKVFEKTEGEYVDYEEVKDEK